MAAILRRSMQAYLLGWRTKSCETGDESALWSQLSHGKGTAGLTAAIAGRTLLVTMLDWSQCPAVERVPGKVSGTWVFRGTRLPVKALFENLEDGARVDEFLQWFPGVTRNQVEAVLEHAGRSVAEV